MCGQCGLLCSTHRDFASYPCAKDLDRLPRAIIRTPLFEKRQHMLGAICRPGRKELVPLQIEWAASMRGNKSSVSHSCILLGDLEGRGRDRTASAEIDGCHSAAILRKLACYNITFLMVSVPVMRRREGKGLPPVLRQEMQER
jgi:hypothetical protein